MSKLTKQEIRDELWRRGNLSWKCHPVQKEMYDLFYASDEHSKLVWLLARQSGKSVLLALLALEHALRAENSIIKMVTDTRSHAESILGPIFTLLLGDCPEDLKPVYNKQKYIYHFGNGSEIQLAGTDNKHYEKLRGQKAVLVLVDEAGFCNDLEEVVDGVLFPTTTHTGGKIVLASTPPEDADHMFLGYIERSEAEGKLTKKTLYDNPLLTNEQKEKIVKEMGGIKSDRFRREYLCELVRNSPTTVIPEFTPDLEKCIVKDWPTPPFYDTYVSMDLGGKDLTAILFAYYDFRADKIVIQRELPIDFAQKGNHIKSMIEQILKIEQDLWTNPYTSEKRTPYMRVSDINIIVTNDILVQSDYQLNFQHARKDNKDAAINQLREMLQSERIIIDPSCETLIRHLRNVKWKSANDKSKFARSPDDSHYDFVDALLYLIRAVVYTKNPYPRNYQTHLRSEDVFVANPTNFNRRHNTQTQDLNVYKKIFGIKK